MTPLEVAAARARVLSARFIYAFSSARIVWRVVAGSALVSALRHQMRISGGGLPAHQQAEQPMEVERRGADEDRSTDVTEFDMDESQTTLP